MLFHEWGPNVSFVGVFIFRLKDSTDRDGRVRVRLLVHAVNQDLMRLGAALVQCACGCGEVHGVAYPAGVPSEVDQMRREMRRLSSMMCCRRWRSVPMRSLTADWLVTLSAARCCVGPGFTAWPGSGCRSSVRLYYRW